jgi:hypothetical protein
MAYTVTTTAGRTLATVADGTVNTTATSITLIGKNYAGYGIFLNENYVEILENFSNSTPPNAPLTGQLWYDSVNEILKVYNSANNIWKPISSSISQSTAPSAAVSVTGDIWWDTTNAQLKVWSGSAWITIGPAYTSTAGTSGPVTQTILDTGSASHVVVIFYISNQAIAILSKDTTFTPQTAIPGFTTIIPGMNLISQASLTGAQFTGATSGTSTFGGLSVSHFMTDQTAFTTPYTLSTAGLTVNSDLVINAGGASAIVQETTANKNVLFQVNQSGVNQTILTLGASNLTGTFAGAVTSTGNLTASAGLTVNSDLVINAGGASAIVQETTANKNVLFQVNQSGVNQTILTLGASNLTGTFAGPLVVAGTTTLQNTLLPSGAGINIGSTGSKFGNVYATYLVGTAVTAQYADLAERFESDTAYPAGTVVALGGAKEITAAADDLTEDVFGVISTKAAFLMNGDAGNDQTHPPIAVNGRVPVRVIGKISKGDRLVSAGSGLARAASRTEITAFNVIGRSLQNKTTDGEGTVEAIVKLNS